MSFTKMKSLHMFRFRVRKNTGLLLKFTQTAVLFQDTSIFFSLEIELSLSSGSYFFFRKLLFHFTRKIFNEVNHRNISRFMSFFYLNYSFTIIQEHIPDCFTGIVNSYPKVAGFLALKSREKNEAQTPRFFILYK